MIIQYFPVLSQLYTRIRKCQKITLKSREQMYPVTILHQEEMSNTVSHTLPQNLIKQATVLIKKQQPSLTFTTNTTKTLQTRSLAANGPRHPCLCNTDPLPRPAASRSLLRPPRVGKIGATYFRSQVQADRKAKSNWVTFSLTPRAVNLLTGTVTHRHLTPLGLRTRAAKKAASL